MLWVIYFFVMYYIYGISGPSLLIESTDSMIIHTQCHNTCTHILSQGWNKSIRPCTGRLEWKQFSDHDLKETSCQYNTIIDLFRQPIRLSCLVPLFVKCRICFYYLRKIYYNVQSVVTIIIWCLLIESDWSGYVIIVNFLHFCKQRNKLSNSPSSCLRCLKANLKSDIHLWLVYILIIIIIVDSGE